MTDDERTEEGAEEPIEDLEAPAEAQGDVVGGANECIYPTCHNPNTRFVAYCRPPSCNDTKSDCLDGTQAIIVHLA
jgi:hypothetical protein